MSHWEGRRRILAGCDRRLARRDAFRVGHLAVTQALRRFHIPIEKTAVGAGDGEAGHRNFDVGFGTPPSVRRACLPLATQRGLFHDRRPVAVIEPRATPVPFLPNRTDADRLSFCSAEPCRRATPTARKSTAAERRRGGPGRRARERAGVSHRPSRSNGNLADSRRSEVRYFEIGADAMPRSLPFCVFSSLPLGKWRDRNLQPLLNTPGKSPLGRTTPDAARECSCDCLMKLPAQVSG